MKLSKQEELIALAAALYLIGVEVEASRERLKELVEKGYDYASREVKNEYTEFTRLSEKFGRVEERYLYLQKGSQHR